MQWAGLNGWWTHHHYDARRSTPGFPDLLLVRPPELIYAEVKTDNGRLTPEQRRVLAMLEATGAEVHVWRPADWDDVVSRLRRGAANGRSH